MYRLFYSSQTRRFISSSSVVGGARVLSVDSLAAESFIFFSETPPKKGVRLLSGRHHGAEGVHLPLVLGPRAGPARVLSVGDLEYSLVFESE